MQFQQGRTMKKWSDVTWRLVVTLCVLAMAQAADPSRVQSLIGHWRNTQIIFGSARDEHIVLRANGVVEKWSVTASRRSSPVRGRWDAQANSLSVDWEDGTRWSGPFTFH